ncbi:prenyltransferase [Nocardioides baekrokdamisoli]|uniref:Prenyltransferase n=1 Tax=Nocardioides baekrokdamisoli TaxID=1804624 RepID=A0A3G9IUU8_9ACTN|nr:prenyltransferase [Nocardioides baekrokdamisoli]BBH16003.1 prenyltransferase [Nocardioides baekrokdamisoli]
MTAGTPHAAPSVDGILTAEQVVATARAIVAMQEPQGAIPFTTGQHADIWNHVEAAMALLAAGLVDDAERAYAWVLPWQRPDGSWPARVEAGVVSDDRGESNVSAYLAVGLWHHWLIRRDRAFLDRYWPAVRAGLDWVVDQQLSFGGIAWTSENRFALLAGCSSIYQSLRAGVALADLMDEPQPEWELAGGRLGHALREHRDLFEDKSKYSMDWYYPVLGGAVRGPAGSALLDSKWDEFVVPGLGVRCVNTNPWVTAAESSELVMALDALGQDDLAYELLRDVQLMRDADGAYWTGWVYGDPNHENEHTDVYWPPEHTTYTAAAIILAVDALGERHGHSTPGSGIMRGTSLAPDFPEIALECGCDSEAARLA